MIDVKEIALFPLGRIVTTRGLVASISPDEWVDALLRHALGDWGDVCDEDRRSNEEALEEGFRLFSVYRSSDNLKFWIITEADRSYTTLLLPEEY